MNYHRSLRFIHTHIHLNTRAYVLEYMRMLHGIKLKSSVKRHTSYSRRQEKKNSVTMLPNDLLLRYLFSSSLFVCALHFKLRSHCRALSRRRSISFTLAQCARAPHLQGTRRIMAKGNSNGKIVYDIAANA